MIKTHWVKKAVVFGAAVTLSLAGYTITDDASASVFCSELEMAGLSLYLDKYYTANYVETSEGEVVTEKTVSETEEQTEVTTKSEVEEVKTSSAKRVSAKKTATSTVSKKYEDLGISIASDYVNIRRRATTDAKIVGKLYRGSAATIVAQNKEWAKITSGNVTGYIKKEFLAIGADAQALASKYGTQYATVKPGTITLNVRMKKSTEATILTQIPEDELYHVEDVYSDWVKINIDGSKGYVSKDFVNIRTRFKKAISLKEERAKKRRAAAARRAERERLEQLAAERAAEAAQQSGSDSGSTGSSNESTSSNKSSSSNKSTSSSTNKSTSSGVTVKGSGTGAQIAAYAQKFVGNPYVYGGSSLTNGADCSGFTMSVYAQFGYSLPHSSAAQAGYGKKVSLSNVQAGDLIFYKNGSTIGHVAIYIGGGKVVHASNARDGIKISNMYYRQPYCARRIAN